MDLFGEMQKAVVAAKEIDTLKDQAEKVEMALNSMGEVAMHLGQTAMSAKVLNAFANAHPFQDAVGDVVVAWMLLWRASVAAPKVEKAKKKDKPFYEGVVKSLQFFVETQLPITMGNLKALKTTSSVAVDMDDASFGG